ncbi:MAG: hypothetical protein NVS1B7_3560 [Candidatus Saccharimonadales bacterium]
MREAHGITNSEPNITVGRLFVLQESGLLIIQRAAHSRSNPLMWEPPGGKIEEEETIASGAVREVWEETGLHVQAVPNVTYQHEYRIGDDGSRYAGHRYTATFGIARVLAGELILNRKEHTTALWVTPEAAFDYNLTRSSNLALNALFAHIQTIKLQT